MSPVEAALAAEDLEGGRMVMAPCLAAREHHVHLLRVAASAFEAMRLAARPHGIGLVAVSGYRSVQRQTEIWNRKLTRATDDGLDLEAALRRNLVYSAPPGFSRHHWGTDVDLVTDRIFDEPRLEPEDWEGDGPCAEAGRWLRENAATFGFLAPYAEERGGFAREPWHWSFAPVAIAFLPRMRRIDWEHLLRRDPFRGAREMARQAEDLLDRLVLAGIDPRLQAAISR